MEAGKLLQTVRSHIGEVARTLLAFLFARDSQNHDGALRFHVGRLQGLGDFDERGDATPLKIKCDAIEGTLNGGIV